MPRISGTISAGHLYNMTPKRICTIFQLQYYALKLWFPLSLSFPPFHSNCSWCLTLQKSYPCKNIHTFYFRVMAFLFLYTLLMFKKNLFSTCFQATSRLCVLAGWQAGEGQESQWVCLAMPKKKIKVIKFKNNIIKCTVWYTIQEILHKMENNILKETCQYLKWHSQNLIRMWDWKCWKTTTGSEMKTWQESVNVEQKHETVDENFSLETYWSKSWWSRILNQDLGHLVKNLILNQIIKFWATRKNILELLTKNLKIQTKTLKKKE